MSRYSQTFTLGDIFNNYRLKNKLPFMNYKETDLGNGKVSVRTKLKTVNHLVFDTARVAAWNFYEALKTTTSGNRMVIGGKLKNEKTGQDECVDAVYEAILAKQQLISFTANNADLIRDALKIGERNRRKGGVTPKLFLRVASIEQIQAMSERQLTNLMQDVMENIYFNDEFAEVRKKWNLEFLSEWTGISANSAVGNYGSKPYAVQKRDWERRVGL